MTNEVKKILFITHSSTMYGGAEDEFERLLKYFSEKKSKYVVDGLFPKGERGSNYASYCNHWSNIRAGTFPEIYLGIRKLIKYLIFFIIQLRDLLKYGKNKKYDIAVVNVSVLVAPILYLKFKKIKTVVFIRETINYKLFRYIIYKLINSNRNIYICVSKNNETDFREITGNKRTVVLYSSVENQSKYVELSDDKLSEKFGRELIEKLSAENSLPIFSVAPICERKNQKLIVEALNILNNNEINFIPYVILIGQKTNDLKYSEELESLIDKYNLNSRIFLLGALKKDILYSLYRFAKAISIVSTSEGLPLVLAEAFKYKIPLIAMNVGGIGEFVKDGITGYIIDNNPKTLASKIIELYQEKNNIIQIKESAYKIYLNCFNLENNMKALEEVILNFPKS